MKIIEYIKPHTPYAVGDIASAEDKVAAELVKDGVAKYYEKSPKNKMVEEPAKAKKSKA
jgi:endonuclease YncB( thermonuclease family)